MQLQRMVSTNQTAHSCSTLLQWCNLYQQAVVCKRLVPNFRIFVWPFSKIPLHPLHYQMQCLRCQYHDKSLQCQRYWYFQIVPPMVISAQVICVKP